MARESVNLNHPCDFFRHQQLAVIPNSCFVLMPFDPKFDIVYETIENALRDRMECKRADDLALAHPVLERILEGIATAELVVAVLTGKNANVFYELGLAHSRTKDVLLLAEDGTDVPFDLKGLHYHTYDIYPLSGREELAKTVVIAAEQIRERQLPEILEKAMSRTRQIIARMETLLATPEKLADLVVRHQASYSSLSNLGYAESGDRDKREYGELLIREKNLLIELIEKGATLRAIVCPPGSPWLDSPRAQQRLDLLLEFLRRDGTSDRCEIVIASEAGLNCLFFGEDVLFEGHKTGVEGGFGWTAVYTNHAWVQTRIRIFDMYFNSARRYTLMTYGRESASPLKNDRQALRQAVINAFEKMKSGKRE